MSEDAVLCGPSGPAFLTGVTAPGGAGIPVRASASLPPCTVLIRTAGEQVLLDTTGAGLMRTPEFAEDLESLRESLPFVIRVDDPEGPVTCECCGTAVFAVPESECVTPRRWRRAVWEPETGRRHTLRRCEWQRAQREGRP